MPSDPYFQNLQPLISLCQLRSLKIGFAESCTGGLLSAWLTALPGVSKFFMGSVISYSTQSKEQVLGIHRSLILTHGEVSLPVARAMARGAKDLLSADWTVSITGIAGPGGGSQEKPVGTVCFAVCGPAFENALCKQFDKSLSRQEIQQQSALFALDLLVDAIK